METKGWQSGVLATLQNVHNAAVMTRNLRTVHKEAGDKLGEAFDESAHVITLVFAKSGIELSCS